RTGFWFNCHARPRCSFARRLLPASNHDRKQTIKHQRRSRPLAEPVTEEILERAVEPNMGWRQQRAITCANRGGGKEANETVVDFIWFCARHFAKHRFWIRWEFAWINCRLRDSIKNFIANALAVKRRADDGFESWLIRAANLGFARCPNCSQRDHIHLRADILGPRNGSSGEEAQNGLE